MDTVKWIVGAACIVGGLILLIIAFTSKQAREIPFSFRDLLLRGTNIDEASALQLAIEGLLGVVVGALVIRFL